MSSNELSVEMDSCIRTFKEHMHLELEPPKMPGVVGCKRGATSPKLSPRSSPRLFRKLMVNKSIRQRRRFTVAHTCNHLHWCLLRFIVKATSEPSELGGGWVGTRERGKKKNKDNGFI
ncbi:hypothetical protein CHARACLAT_022822 [Characodon lateralis]|uniref:Uncharacterized protein n=1 Tax=Characodon lateralis TaxID=208331 RepID=A0ABU7EDC8_9TELE|nr:hypothetical protein [Characodon lateralis]